MKTSDLKKHMHLKYVILKWNRRPKLLKAFSALLINSGLEGLKRAYKEEISSMVESKEGGGLFVLDDNPR